MPGPRKHADGDPTRRAARRRRPGMSCPMTFDEHHCERRSRMRSKRHGNAERRVETEPRASSRRSRSFGKYSPTRRQMAKTALENMVQDLTSHVSEPRSRMESAGRTGSRQGTVSELTLILPFAPGGARRLRALLQTQNGNFDDADKVGTVHDMRFVFLDKTRSFSSPLPTTATGTPISTTSRRRFPTTWTSPSPLSKAGRGFTARR